MIIFKVWQIWKVNSSVPSWSMATALQRMIQSLVDLRRDCVNYAHLARLFRSQLLNVAQLVNDEEETDGPLGNIYVVYIFFFNCRGSNIKTTNTQLQ